MPSSQKKSRKQRKVRQWLMASCCVLLLGFALAAWLLAGALMATANCPVGPPPRDLPVRTTTLASASGSQIATWYIPVEKAHATVILLHAIRGNRRAMLGRARLFHNAGYSVVMVDLQAHGESLGRNITLGFQERHDVCAAVTFARKINPKHRIAVVGCSLGGAAALLASPLRVDAAVIESVYPTIAEEVHDRIAIRLGPLSDVFAPALLCQLSPRWGISLSELRPIDHLASIGCPVLVAAGDQDQHTTLVETQRLFDAARQPKKLVLFPGAAHVDLLAFNPKRYENEILPFLAEHLAD